MRVHRTSSANTANAVRAFGSDSDSLTERFEYWSSPWIRKNGIHSFDKQTSTRLLEFEVAIYQPDSNGNYRESSLRSDGPQMFSFSNVSRKAISRLWVCMFYWPLDCPNGHIAYICVGYFALSKIYVNHIELNVKTFEIERKKRANIL